MKQKDDWRKHSKQCQCGPCSSYRKSSCTSVNETGKHKYVVLSHEWDDSTGARIETRKCKTCSKTRKFVVR